MLNLDHKILPAFAFALAVALLPRVLLADTVLVPAGSTWKYLDDGSDQGTAWRESGFDDGDWEAGPAQLGYGDGDEATVVGFGPDPGNKYVTTYFRHAFSVSDPSAFACLRLRLLRDDGAVVYLNGTEISRFNMPSGTIDYSTHAASVVGSDDEDAFWDSYLYPDELRAGANVIATEIHQVSGTSSDISFDLDLTGLTELPPLMHKAPYLTYTGVNTWMRVNWQLLLEDSCIIEWGPDVSYSQGTAQTAEYGNDHQHTYTITGLTPGEIYCYRVSAAGGDHTGSFRAAPPEDANSVRFFAYGDTRTYPANHDAVAAGMVVHYTADPGFQTFVLSVGDLVSEGDSETDWDQEFFDASYDSIQTLLRTLPYQAAMGNHEGSGVLFVKYFPYPFVDSRYWSFDYGPAHFAVVDQYTSYQPGSAQLTWLADDLASTARPWKFICLHEPGWTAGGHEHNPNVRNYIQPLCEQHGVAILFAGHNHYYARAVVNDVQHVITGGGGAPLHTPDPGYPNVVAAAKAYHFCCVEIDGGLLHFQALSPAHAVIDSFTIALADAGIQAEGDRSPERLPGTIRTCPNPFTGSTRVEFTAPAASAVALEIYDTGGRLVRTLLRKRVEAGTQSAIWDGRDTGGRDVPAGVYLVRLRCRAQARAAKIVLIR